MQTPCQPLRRWLLHLNPDLLKGPFNHSERALVGLPRPWYDPQAWGPDVGAGMPGSEAGTAGEKGGAKRGAGKRDAEAVAAAAVGGGRLEGGVQGNGAAAEAAAAAAMGKWGRQGNAQSGAGEAVRLPVPVRGARCARLEGPLPLLSGEQLTALAARLTAFVDVEEERQG